MRLRGEGGQSTVELALSLPFVLALLLALVQAGLVVRDQVLVDHAARDAVRVAAVSPDGGRIRTAALGASDALDGDHVVLRTSGRGAPGSEVTVVVDYESPVRLPIIGLGARTFHLTGRATMLVES